MTLKLQEKKRINVLRTRTFNVVGVNMTLSESIRTNMTLKLNENSKYVEKV